GSIPSNSYFDGGFSRSYDASYYYGIDTSYTYVHGWCAAYCSRSRNWKRGYFQTCPLLFPKTSWNCKRYCIDDGWSWRLFPTTSFVSDISITGSYSIGFMAFSQFALVSLLLVLWMYYMDRINLSQDVFNSANQGIIVTDQTGKIVSVNNAFVKITGYDEKDAIGERANILSSGNQDKELFAEMWKQITSKGEWHGEILNKH